MKRNQVSFEKESGIGNRESSSLPIRNSIPHFCVSFPTTITNNQELSYLSHAKIPDRSLTFEQSSAIDSA